VNGADDGGGVHAYVVSTSSTRAGDGAPPSLDPVSCISLFQKIIVITGLTDVRRAIATVT
jgi:hypothetical protein